MSIQPGKRAKFLTAFLIGLGLVMAFTLVLAGKTATPSFGIGGTVEDPVPEMRIFVMDPPNACIDSQCQIGIGETFTLGVEIVSAPDFDDLPSDTNLVCDEFGDPGCQQPGYVQAQSFVWFGPNISWDSGSTATADDFIWPDCNTTVAVRFQNVAPNAEDPPPVSEVLAHGCATGLLPPLPVSNYLGTFVTMILTCSLTDTDNLIQLLPSGDRFTTAATNGALYTNPGALQIIPKVNSLSMFCGTPPTPTITPTITPGGPTFTPSPTPTITPTITPTPTPALTPTATFVSTFPCGDINGDRLVNAEDALWLLWFSSGMIPSLPNPGGVILPGDVNGDGFVDPLDALFVLWIELNLFRCL